MEDVVPVRRFLVPVFIIWGTGGSPPKACFRDGMELAEGPLLEGVDAL